MQIKSHLIFWLIVSVILNLLFSMTFNSYYYTIYFTSLLLPVIVATSYFFNYYLVPKYLLNNLRFKFGLYLIYTLIVSLYMELVVIYLAFIYLANYNILNMHPLVSNVWILTITLYAIVFVHGFILLLKKYQNTKQTVSELEIERKKEEVGYLTVKSERQNKRINYDDIIYIESLADYVKIYAKDRPPIITKQKISKIQLELTDAFLRIHRSYIVNIKEMTSFGADYIMIDHIKLPISRTYKEAVKTILT